MNIALFQILLPWIDSHSSVATRSGKYALTEQIAGASLVTAPRGTWFTLDIDNFKMDDKSVVQQLAERFVPDGLVRWSFVQSGLQKTDVNGKTIPHSRFTAQFLFKHHHVWETIAKSIHMDYNNHEQQLKDEANVKDDFLFNFLFFVHPHFPNVIHAEPISPASQMQIMALTPHFDVIPALVGSAERAMQVKQVIHSLHHFEFISNCSRLQSFLHLLPHPSPHLHPFLLPHLLVWT